MKKKKLWKHILSLTAIALITTSTIATSSNMFRKMLVKSTNSESNPINNKYENISNHNENARIKNDIPSKDNVDINWCEYEFIANGFHVVGSSLYNNVVPNKFVCEKMFPDIARNGSINLLDFLWLNDNFVSACSKRYKQIINWFNKETYPGLSWRIGIFGDLSDGKFNSIHLQGVKFKSIEYNQSRNKFQVTTALACQFYKGTGKYAVISPVKQQTDIVIELDPPFWFNVDFASIVQPKIDENNGIILNQSLYSSIINDYIHQNFSNKFMNITTCPNKISYWWGFSEYKNPVAINFLVNFPDWQTTNNGTLSNTFLRTKNIYLKFSKTDIFSSIDAQTIGEFVPEFKTLNINEILQLWNQNPNNKLFINFNQKINSELYYDYEGDILAKHIFINAPLNKNSDEISIKSIEPTTGPNSYNSLKFVFNLKKAMGEPGSSPLPNLELSTTVTNFKTDIVTNLIKTTIDATDPEFKTIFGSNNKGFAVDFDNDKTKNQTKLKDYINAHISDFFGDTKGVEVNVSDVVINVNSNTNSATATITYSGLNNNHQFVTNNIATINITNLKPNPAPSTFADFQQFLQNKVDTENKGATPTNDQIKQWVAAYLTQPDITAKLPDAVGNISSNNITLDVSKIHKDNSPITFDEGAIKTNTNPILTFPSLSITVKNTIIKASIVASSPINNYYTSEILVLWNNNKDDPKITAIKSWINDNKATIFTDLPEDATITLKDMQSVSNENTSLNITLTVSKAYTIDQGLVTDKDYTIKITNFNSAPINETILKKTNINYYDPEFKEIFTNCTNGYTVDFNKDVANEESQLMNYMNNHIEAFFDNIENINILVNNVSITVETSDNIATAIITYNGFNSNGEYTENKTSNILISLRPTPDSNGDTNNLFTDFNKILQDKVNQNDGIFPNNEILKEWVSEYLNTKKDQLPNASIPSSKKFEPSNIVININGIHKGENIIIDKKAISTSGTDIQLLLPGAKIFIKLTTLKNDNLIDVSNSPISDIDVSQLINDKNDPNSTSIQRVNEYLNVRKKSIFNNLPNEATITIIPGSISTNLDNTLSLSVQVSQAYTPNGLEINVAFKAQMCGLSNIQTETTLKITEIVYKQPLFKDIWINNKGYAVDWAYLTPKEIEGKETRLLEYINADVQAFFNHPIITNQDVVSEVNFEFSEFKESNIINIEITFSGIKDDIKVNDLRKTIKLVLCSDTDNYMGKIFGPNGSVRNEIQNWINQYPKKPLTKNELVKIVNESLDNPINPYDPDNHETYGDLLPDIYPHEITLRDIDQEKIYINDDKVTIDAGAIQIKPQLPIDESGQPITPQGNWGPAENIISPDLGTFESNKLKNNESNHNQWFWIIIGASVAAILILIILIIIFVSKVKRKEDD